MIGRPPPPPTQVACARFAVTDFEILETAQAIMGNRTLSDFIREAALGIARAIIEARADLDSQGEHGPTSWDSCWIEGSLERKR